MKRWIAWVQIAVPLLFLLDIVANLLVRFPDNHGAGFGSLYRPFYWSWGAVLVAGLAARRIDLRGLACGFAVLTMFFFSDKYNLYLEYEEWLCRGMPRWGSFDDGWRNRDVETLKRLQEEESAERCEYPTSLRACAISINEIADFRNASHGITGLEPSFHVYVSDNVPWDEVPLKPLADISPSNETLVPKLAEAFGVSFWMSDWAAVFATKIHDGKFEIRGSNNSPWLDDLIPSELAYRPKLQAFGKHCPEKAPAFALDIDESCREMIVPLIEIRLTWRHCLELLTIVLPIEVIVDDNRISITRTNNPSDNVIP